MNNVTLRSAHPNDAECLGTICYEAFRQIAERHNFPPDFASAAAASNLVSSMIDDPLVYSVVAEQAGRVIGSNFLWEQSVIAAVGPITVDPSAQDGGIGRVLMSAVLDRAHQRRFAGVRLVQAAYHQRSLSLYAKLGFEVRESLFVLQGQPLGLDVRGARVRPAREEDLSACNRLAMGIHGHERGQELRNAIQRSMATVLERDGRIAGYATSIGFFGHAVAETNDDLKALIAAAPSFQGPGFLVPARNADLLRWCLANHIRLVQPMTLMSIGQYNEPAGAFLPSVLF